MAFFKLHLPIPGPYMLIYRNLHSLLFLLAHLELSTLAVSIASLQTNHCTVPGECQLLSPVIIIIVVAIILSFDPPMTQCPEHTPSGSSTRIQVMSSSSLIERSCVFII